MAGLPPSQSGIDALHTTTPNLADIKQCTYMHDRPTTSQSSLDALHTTTPNLADITDIAQCTYIHGILTPHSQASIDALNTATQHLAHLMADLAYISAKPLHQISFIYSTMHIYPWQIDTPHPIEHRSLQNHYTK